MTDMEKVEIIYLAKKLALTLAPIIETQTEEQRYNDAPLVEYDSDEWYALKDAREAIGKVLGWRG